jgi:hypothetical protein
VLRFAVHSPAQRRASPRSHRMPCGDISRCIHISVSAVPAGPAGEVGLALTRLSVYGPARAAALRGVRGANLLDAAWCLVLEPARQQAPTGAKDGPVQSGFLPHVAAGPGVSALGRAGHVRNAQIFDTDHIEAAGQVGRGLLGPILAPRGRAGIEPSDRSPRALTAIRSALGAGKPPLQPAQPRLLVLTQTGTVKHLAGRQRCRNPYAAIDADDAAGTRPWNGPGDGGERDVPAFRPVKRNAVRLGRRDSTRPAETHPACLRHPYLADVAGKTPYVRGSNGNDPESFVPTSFPPCRPATYAGEEARHSLSEVPQRLLLHHLAAFGQPTELGPGRGQLTALLDVPWRTGAAGTPVRLLLHCEVPHVPSMRTMSPEDHVLRLCRNQAVTAHKSNIRSSTDIPEGTGARPRCSPRSPARRRCQPHQVDSSKRSSKAYLGRSGPNSAQGPLIIRKGGA